MLKKAQASMEFLMTYGWAILVVIIIIALLLNSRIGGDPTLLLQENCEFYITVFCLDYFVEEDQIKLSLQNIAERDITVKNIIATSDALEGQCELTGIHMGQPLKNGEDFLFQLNRTVMVDRTFAPPVSTNINWNLPESQILLARAQGSDDTYEIELLHEILNGTNTDTHYEGDEQEFGNLLNNLTGPSKTQFNTQLRDPSLIDPSSYTDLTAYKARVISVLEDILDNATNRNYTAYNISKEANLSNSSFTKAVLWNTIINETETSIFSLPPGRGNNLETYATSHSDYATNYSVSLGCSDLDTLKQARLNYAAYEIFVNTNASNADPSLSREELYNNLSRSIAFIKTFYSGFEDAEEAGVNEMASIVNNTFKNPPEVLPEDEANLLITDTPECLDGFDIDEITLNNIERASEVVDNPLTVNNLIQGTTVGNLNEGLFGNDAYCALLMLVSDITSADINPITNTYGASNVGYGRTNFDNDGVEDHYGDTVSFFDYVLSLDRLTDVNDAVDRVANGTVTPADYRHSPNFNGADMNTVIKLIQDEKLFIDISRISNKIMDLFLNNDTLHPDNLDSNSKTEIIESVLNDNSLRLTYSWDYDSIDRILEVIRSDDAMRISDTIIETGGSDGRLVLNSFWLSHKLASTTVKHVISDTRFGLHGLDPDNLDSESISRIIELIHINKKINDVTRPWPFYGRDLHSDPDLIIADVLNDNNLVLTYYSNDNSINALIEIARNDLGLFDDSWWYFEVLNPELIKELFDTAANSNYEHLNNPTYRPVTKWCINYPDYTLWRAYGDSDSVSARNILAFYLNTWYDPSEPNSRLYTRKYKFEEDDPNTFRSFNSDVYYELLYDAIVYAAAVNVSNADDPVAQANEVKKGVAFSANLFLFNVITAPYTNVKKEYTTCYDTTKLFDPESGTLEERKKAYISHCMANYVKYHFENFTYQDVIDSELNSSDLTLFLTNTARFYRERIQEIRNSVFDAIDYVEQVIGFLLPTPSNVCQAANDAASHPDLQSPTLRREAGAELIADFDAKILLNHHAPDCESLPPTATTLDILRAVGQAAAQIIVPAEKDASAVPSLITFINDWLSSQPPTISLQAPTDPASAVFPVTITAHDYEGRLDMIKIRILSEGSTTFVEDIDIADILGPDCDKMDCIIDRDINAGLFLNQQIILLVQAIDTEGNIGEADEIINVPDKVQPLIDNFELIAVSHRNERDNYYTEFLVRVTAKDEHNQNLTNIKLDLPLDLNSHLNPNLDLVSNVPFFSTPPPVTITPLPSGGSPFPFYQTCTTTPTEKTECVKEFTIVASRHLNDKTIVISATANSATGGDSLPSSLSIIIPQESINGCIHRDLGTKKNRYSLRLIYAWEESPDIDHTITGTLLTTAPDITE